MTKDTNFEFEHKILNFFDKQLKTQYDLCVKAYQDKDVEGFEKHFKAYNIARLRLVKEMYRMIKS